MPISSLLADVEAIELPVSYSFRLFFTNSLGKSDAAFQEVQGFKSTMECEEFRAGGENRFSYQLPKGIKNDPLVLKRGIAPINSSLVKMCKKVVDDNLGSEIVLQPISLYLMNDLKIPIRIWIFYDAWPCSWEVDSFNSTKNEVAVETITFNYNTVTRIL